ncbi:MAG: DUF4403 family protein [Nitrospinae bacterium]|nr:DUF4403 family protein [Nitrospinota bacterium]
MGKLFALLLAACFGAACGGLNVPKPTFEAHEPPPEAPLEVSEIEIPVAVYLQPILEKAEATVPKEIATAGWEVIGTSPAGDVGVQYKLSRDPLALAMRGNTAVASLHSYFWLNVGHRMRAGLLGGAQPPWMLFGTCGQKDEPPREMVFTLETELAWNQRWGLDAKTKILPNTHPVRCAITALELDVTDPINRDVRPKLEAVGTMMDQKIAAEADFHKLADDVWRKLQEPAVLDNDVWLVVNPETIYVAPLSGDGMKVETKIRITARPEVVGGKRPAPKIRPLPPLQVREGGSGLFRIRLKGELPFDVAARQLAKRLAEKPIEMDKRQVRVEDVVIYPSGELCVLQLKVSGAVNGKVYFAGKPVYDGESDALTFENLDYTIATMNVLHTVGDWFLHDAFRQQLVKAASFKVGGELNGARARLEQAVNKSLDGHTRVQATVTALKLKSFFMTSKAFRAVVEAQGSARVVWK